MKPLGLFCRRKVSSAAGESHSLPKILAIPLSDPPSAGRSVIFNRVVVMFNWGAGFRYNAFLRCTASHLRTPTEILQQGSKTRVSYVLAGRRGCRLWRRHFRDAGAIQRAWPGMVANSLGRCRDPGWNFGTLNLLASCPTLGRLNPSIGTCERRRPARDNSRP